MDGCGQCCSTIGLNTGFQSRRKAHCWFVCFSPCSLVLLPFFVLMLEHVFKGTVLIESIQMLYIKNKNKKKVVLFSWRSEKDDSHFYFAYKIICTFNLRKALASVLIYPFLVQRNSLVVGGPSPCLVGRILEPSFLSNKQACLDKNCRILKLNYHDSCLLPFGLYCLSIWQRIIL